jgi:hypothetical protein
VGIVAQIVLVGSIFRTIETLDQFFGHGFQRICDSKQRGKCDGPTRFDLLPMPRGKAAGNHVFLSMAGLLAQSLDSLAEKPEEFLLISHSYFCRVSRANSPRAD